MWRRAGTICLAAVVGAVLAGCGSGAGGTGSSGGSGAPTGSEIVVGYIGSVSGPSASSLSGGTKVVEAWAKAVNDAGGIAGHKVRLVTKDDGANPTKSLQSAKELVEQEKVVAIVGENSVVDASWAKYVEAAGVPVVGGFPGSVSMYTNAGFFPVGTSSAALQYGALTQAKKLGNKGSFLYCAESPICAETVASVQSLAQVVAMELPVVAKVSGSAPDYTATCQSLKAEGVQSYNIGAAAATTLRIVANCNSQGVTAKFVVGGSNFAPNWLNGAGLDGAVQVSHVGPFFDTSTPGGKAYREFLTKYVPDLGDQDSGITYSSYLGGKLFERAVEMGPKNGEVTAASIKQGLYALEGETLQGSTAPLTYTQGKPTANICYFVMSIQGGKFTTPEGAQPQCAPESVNQFLPKPA
nr:MULTISPECIES: ABC transporter substrate-binding protein [unclassified Pseudonocardia]